MSKALGTTRPAMYLESLDSVLTKINVMAFATYGGTLIAPYWFYLGDGALPKRLTCVAENGAYDST